MDSDKHTNNINESRDNGLNIAPEGRVISYNVNEEERLLALSAALNVACAAGFTARLAGVTLAQAVMTAAAAASTVMAIFFAAVSRPTTDRRQTPERALTQGHTLRLFGGSPADAPWVADATHCSAARCSHRGGEGFPLPGGEREPGPAWVEGVADGDGGACLADFDAVAVAAAIS